MLGRQLEPRPPQHRPRDEGDGDARDRHEPRGSAADQGQRDEHDGHDPEDEGEGAQARGDDGGVHRTRVRDASPETPGERV
ncbi:hypothetical protein Q9Q99_17970 [Curtobacterium flaccumfaciens]|nr:hypothetical protein Q9Q99_17970 [Curtobacterium flaccumfaciens]